MQSFDRPDHTGCDLCILGQKPMWRFSSTGFQTFTALPARPACQGYKLLTDAFLEYARRYGASNWHPAGTCKMGIDPLAFVDPSLKVHGIANLRVVDVSVMPNVIGGKTNAPTIMIAEKAADAIQER